MINTTRVVTYRHTATCSRCGAKQSSEGTSDAHASAAALTGFGHITENLEAANNSNVNRWLLCEECMSFIDAWLHGVTIDITKEPDE